MVCFLYVCPLGSQCECIHLHTFRMLRSMLRGRLKRNLKRCRTLRAFRVESALSFLPNTSWNRASAVSLAPVQRKSGDEKIIIYNHTPDSGRTAVCEFYAFMSILSYCMGCIPEMIIMFTLIPTILYYYSWNKKVCINFVCDCMRVAICVCVSHY